ncbi:hypothetical protein HPB52_008017 [Rhipicephalus sanguineus]|uniref:Peptidase M12B domain-containing protein n=1 Tax=Rhipicephalus sanguineus TaxID=34632 RepID=A0A9D4PQN9_RHISA|nr:hypothetical protein HPB52_008017 [Rhipicephalus sanguineus]
MRGRHSMLLSKISYVIIIVMIYISESICSGRVLNRYVRHYEPLSYEPVNIHGRGSRGGRWKRSVGIPGDLDNLQVTFKALNSRVVGGLTKGVFLGRIALSAADGTEEHFHVESASRYLGPDRDPRVHSIIYSARDVVPSGGRCGLYGATETFLSQIRKKHRKDPKEQRRDGKSRRKRSLVESAVKAHGTPSTAATPTEAWKLSSAPLATAESPESRARELGGAGSGGPKRRLNLSLKRVCNVEVVVDHLLFESYLNEEGGERDKALEAITTMVGTHAASATEIFGKTDFEGITGISFEVQRLRINESNSCEGRVRHTNPFCREDLDAAHVLFEMSKINHDSFCVSHMWTYRDFTGGTLGLAYLAESEGPNASERMDPDLVRAQQFHFGANVVKALTYRGSLSLNTGLVTFVNNNVRLTQRDTEVTFAHELGHNFGSPHDYPPKCTPGGTQGNYLMYPSARRGTEPNNLKFSPCSIGNISLVLKELIAGEAISPNCLQEPRGPFCGNKVREKEKSATAATTSASAPTAAATRGRVGRTRRASCGPERSADPGSECREACSFRRMRSLCHKKLQPGALCDDFHGYCDVFQQCRHIDTEGPLTRLQWLVFGNKGFTNLLARHWFLTAMGVVVSAVATVSLLRVCAVYVPSSNPHLRPAKKIAATVRHPLDFISHHIRRR